MVVQAADEEPDREHGLKDENCEHKAKVEGGPPGVSVVSRLCRFLQGASPARRSSMPGRMSHNQLGPVRGFSAASCGRARRAVHKLDHLTRTSYGLQLGKTELCLRGPVSPSPATAHGDRACAGPSNGATAVLHPPVKTAELNPLATTTRRFIQHVLRGR